MQTTMPCWTDSEELNRLPPDEPGNLDHARAVEDYADNLMAECVRLAGARAINTAHDLYDGDLLPSLMAAVANWKGSTVSASQQMHKLHNILAEALQAVAEREVK